MAYSSDIEQMDNEVKARFESWWQNEGSCNDNREDEDTHEWMYRKTKEAWMNGSFVAQTEVMKRSRK